MTIWVFEHGNGGFCAAAKEDGTLTGIVKSQPVAPPVGCPYEGRWRKFQEAEEDKE